jgi:crossover junction endodeoxyribonuclease RuvC
LPPPPLRVLGVDAALRTTGVAILEAAGSRLTALHFGLIVNPPARAHSAALHHLRGELGRLIDVWAPAEAAIEGVFFCRNARTALALGEARGAILSLCAERAVPIYEYAPRLIKRSVAGRGAAGKDQVGGMVRAMLGIPGEVPEDAADALAVALCHVHSGLQRSLGTVKPI